MALYSSEDESSSTGFKTGDLEPDHLLQRSSRILCTHFDLVANGAKTLQRFTRKPLNVGPRGEESNPVSFVVLFDLLRTCRALDDTQSTSRLTRHIDLVHLLGAVDISTDP